MGAEEVRAFLSDLAANQNVAASKTPRHSEAATKAMLY
jgi:hypothetical protein